MLKLLRLMICLSLTLVVASGCGTTKTASTATVASTSTGTTGTAGSAGQTPAPSTSPQQPLQTSKPPAPKPATPAAEAKGSQTGGGASQPSTPVKPQPAKLKFSYPPAAQSDFIANCTAAHASKSSCECVIIKYESGSGEEAQSLVELLGLELALKEKTQLPHLGQLYVKECKLSIT